MAVRNFGRKTAAQRPGSPKTANLPSVTLGRCPTTTSTRTTPTSASPSRSPAPSWRMRPHPPTPHSADSVSSPPPTLARPWRPATSARPSTARWGSPLQIAPETVAQSWPLRPGGARRPPKGAYPHPFADLGFQGTGAADSCLTSHDVSERVGPRSAAGP